MSRSRVVLSSLVLLLVALCLTAGVQSASATETTVLELEGPSTGDFGWSIRLYGQLTVNGEPVAGANLSVSRRSPDGSMTALESRTTAYDGRFGVVDYINEVRGEYTYVVTFEGDGEHAAAEASWVVDVHGSTAELEMLQPAPDWPKFYRVGNDVMVQGVLTDKRDYLDPPIQGAAIKVRQSVAGGEPTEVASTTDSYGRFTVTLPDVSLGRHDIEVVFPGDAVYQPLSTSFYFTVLHETVLTLAGPTELPTDYELVTFTGRLTTDTGEAIGGASVSFRVNGGFSGGTVTTAADGTYVFQRIFDNRQPLTLTAQSAQGETYGPATAGQRWYGVRRLFINTDRSAYVSGDSAAIEASVNDTIADEQIRMTPYGNKPISIPRNPDDSGTTRFTRTLTRNTTITLSTPLDGDHLAASLSRVIPVSPRFAQALSGSYASSGSYLYVHKSTDPRLKVTVSPNRSGKCVYARTQKLVSGTWTAFRRSSCIRLNSLSYTSYVLTGSPAAGARFRMRFESSSDSMNVRGYGSWRYVKFTS